MGVPDITPLLASTSPGGKAPETRVYAVVELDP